MYEYQAAKIYGPNERYNTGAGISVASNDLTHLQRMFDARKKDPEPYALRIKNCATGEIVCEHGSIDAANRSMVAAYRRRQTAG